MQFERKESKSVAQDQKEGIEVKMSWLTDCN